MLYVVRMMLRRRQATTASLNCCTLVDAFFELHHPACRSGRDRCSLQRSLFPFEIWSIVFYSYFFYFSPCREKKGGGGPRPFYIVLSMSPSHLLLAAKSPFFFFCLLLLTWHGSSRQVGLIQ